MTNLVQPQEPLPHQESVWSYPRPPRVEASSKRVRVIFNQQTIADSQHTFRVLETSHPPVYYIPQEDIDMQFLARTRHHTFCEYKGMANYWTLKVGDKISENAAWGYANPTPGYEAIKGHLAFYVSRVDACFVNDEQVRAQEGDFYGGWITSDIVGPFKGGPGTWEW